jgi:hypothetical protein
VKRRLGLILLFAIACSKREAPPPQAAAIEAPISDVAERMSLCDMARGGTLASRTGEALLETSALQTIDGDPGSFWMTPMHDLPQSITIALPARSRIQKVGIRTVVKGGFSTNHVTFEASTDDRGFSPLASIKSAATDDAQWFDVAPVEASYIRVTIVDSTVADHDVRLYSILVRGTELEPARAGDITGCWSLNGEQARFERRGSHVVGILQTGKEPIRFEGAIEGPIYRLSWIRGNDYGMTLLTVSPDGRHLSAANWHEEAIPMFFDTSWFGERNRCSMQVPDSTQVAAALLRRTGRYSLYGDSEVLPLLRLFPTYRFVAHEFRFPTAKENHDAAERALAPLQKQFEGHNIEFVAAGSDNPRQEPVTESMRSLYSTIDVEIRR